MMRAIPSAGWRGAWRSRAATALALAAMFCGGSSQPGSPTTPSPATPSTAACAVQAGGPPGPVLDPNGPYYHQVVVAHTTDGITLDGLKQVLDHASVPDGARPPPLLDEDLSC